MREERSSSRRMASCSVCFLATHVDDPNADRSDRISGYAFSSVHGKLYPSVGLRTPGEMVRANFGSEPFRFDIDSLVRVSLLPSAQLSSR